MEVIRIFYISASLGGTFGICIGASFLTLLEFLEYIVVALFALIRNQYYEILRKRRVNAVQV